MKAHFLLVPLVLATALCPSLATAQEFSTGTRGTADQRAAVNFSELARQEAVLRNAQEAAPALQPAEFVSAEASLLSSPSSVSASPQPASSFPAADSSAAPPPLTSFSPPPDTQGAVGPNHLMVALNFVGVRVQDRAGGVIRTVSPSNFWAAVGPFNVFTNIAMVTDPQVLYDPYGHRFVYVTIANFLSNNAVMLIGASRTSDPTADWNLYRIDVDPTNHQVWLDHPTVGFNKDWIVVQGGIYLVGGGFVRSDVFVFNKTNLYAGGAGLFTRFQRSDLGRFQAPATVYDDTLGTMYLLEQVGTGNNLNSVRLYTITGPIGSEVFALGPIITTTNRWDYTPPGGLHAEFAPQLGSTRKIVTIASLMLSLVYRDGSLWAVHHIFLPAGGSPSRCSVQWWQLSTNGLILQRGLIDDPSGRTFYAYPSLSVNRFNDVLIGYSRFGSNQYASANYSFRAANDPPDTLRRDVVLKTGEAPYSLPAPNATIIPWGDYSATTIDPLNDVDFWTIQEYAASPLDGLDRWGTWWGRIVPPALSLYISDATVTEGDAGTTNAVFTLSLSKTNDQVISVDFTTADGSALAGADYLPTNGTVVFNPGETNQTVVVSVLGDRLDETNETFFVNLSNPTPTNIDLAYTQGLGTILDNDPPPALAINDVSVWEGDAGLADATFTLSLSAPSGLPVSLRAMTANGAATLRVDYVPTNVMVMIPPGTTNQTLNIQVIGDTLIESNETFFVNLSAINATIADSRGQCTILDDDFKLTAAEIFGSDVRISFNTATNQTYRLEWTENLSGAILWQTVPGAQALLGTGAIVQVIDPGGATRPQRFYRVRLN